MKLDSYMPVKIISGKDCVKKNSSVFSSFGKKCLIVTGGSSAKKSGALGDCIFALDERGIDYIIFDKITANPFSDSCFEAGKLAREEKVDFIVGIGGGSPLDASKAVAIYAADPDMGVDDIYKRTVPAKALPVVLIGTTAGTGSEVTGVSVLTSRDSGRKKSISGADCYAAVSFCDHTYTLTVPAFMTLSTALDAFAHAVESYLNSTANSLSSLYSEKAIALLKDYILSDTVPQSLSENEREVLYTASLYAGLAINIAGCGFPHTVGYYLTENYNVPHGIACAAFMPLLLDRAKKYRPERLGAIETVFGVDANTLANIVKSKIKFDFVISQEEAESAALRWKDGVRNFDRSPGGFDYTDAAKALTLI